MSYAIRVLMLVLGLALAGCSPEGEAPGKQTGAAKGAAQAASSASAGFVNYTETGDLAAIRERGVLRLLAPRRTYQGLPRSGMPTDGYRAMAEAFARDNGLKPQWIIKDSLGALIPALLAGEGDLVVNHLTQTPERRAQVAFSLPISRASERLLSAKAAGPFESLEALQGKTVVVPVGSSYEQSLLDRRLAEPELDFTVEAIEHSGNPDLLVDLVVAGEYDATVLDDNVAQTLSQYREDFAVGAAVSETRPVGWAMRPDATDLQSRLNQYLTSHTIARSGLENRTDDLAGIKERGVIRMITRNNPASYFMWRGELMGFEYDLLKEYAKEQGLRLEVEVAPPGVDPIDWLQAGRGDVIAAAMTVTPKRAERVAFSRYYNKVAEQLVTNRDHEPLDELAALEGRTLVINPDHAYWQSAQRLKNGGVDFTLTEPEQDLSSTEILLAVADGQYDATIADSHLVAIEKRFATALAPGFEFAEREHAWAVRPENPELLASLNEFLQRHYRGLFFNVTYNKYFENDERIGRYQGERLTFADGLSPYDDVVKPLGNSYQFDWRLIVAQMYQESRFRPDARSYAGARGLLQVLPSTAKELGFSLPFNEEAGIEAGVTYLDWTRDRFEEYLPLDERLWFALAAYNAGFGHVQDARRLARQKGWNPDVWFNNVERAMLLLSRKEYYRNARFGYVRGTEPVHYVRNIRERYQGYLAAE
ncbi:transporter substrate-binding domain-containing protein [Gilvimarinus xylanilyticus]|uniref:Transporter substrate-binding domain-containing protein n=1 Tax=Gilvimarinus xylanilyticus TaxID=2944139 RepID=A0A9X2I526_9GAMM|nr:transporter substrate-binding domain-containing protein [Gilvimarinus xylanilyticus]MCP8899057.1 transporter substrate-binding domain-containing protein [Gilvimarinus xylanilyticus]